MVWLETPTNPLMKLTDIKAVADSLKSRPDIILVVDNTFLTCYYQVSLLEKLYRTVFNTKENPTHVLYNVLYITNVFKTETS